MNAFPSGPSSPLPHNTRKIITPAEAAAELMKRRRLKVSLHSFLKEAWPIWMGARPFRDSWYLGAIAEHVEAVVNGEIRNLLLNQPPRTSKSSLCGVCLVPWLWITYPHMHALCASYDGNLSKRDHRTARELIQSEWYQARWGNIYQLTGDQNTKDEYRNTKGGVRVATATDGSTTGSGGDIVIIDDPNNAKDVSDTALEKTLFWWHTVMPTRLNNRLNVKRIVIQQRLHEKDLSGDILSKNSGGEWVHLKLPLEFEWSSRCVTVVLPSTKPHRWMDPRKKPGETLDPNYFTPFVVKELKDELETEYAISGQLQQRPSPGDGGILKKSWFKLWPEKLEDGSYPANLPKMDFIVVSIDTALNDTKGSAFNAATTWGVFKDRHGVGNTILLSLWQKRCEWPEMRDVMLRMSDDYLDDGDSPLIKKTTTRKPDMMLVEDKGFGMLLARDLGRAGKTVTKFNPHGKGDKVQRVRIVSPLIEGGRVWLPLSAENNYRTLRPFAQKMLDNAIKFPKAATRDLVDTMAQFLYRMQASGWIWNQSDGGPSSPQDTSARGTFY